MKSLQYAVRWQQLVLAYDGVARLVAKGMVTPQEKVDFQVTEVREHVCDQLPVAI